MKSFLTSLRMKLVLTLLTGVLYPLIVWAAGRLAFHDQAEGSLVTVDGRVVGSALIAQKTTGPRYFWPRPSATGFATVASGASGQSWTSAKLAARLQDSAKTFREGNELPVDAAVPADVVTASGSGLDPEVSVEAARLQAGRVAAARHLDRGKLDELITRCAVGGALTPERINVLRLNLALDAAFP